MQINTVKQALAAGQVQLGTQIAQMRSGEATRALAAAGFHWVFLDTEHGGLDLETVQDLARACANAGLCPLVRVPDLQYALVARALDCGAQGIIFPRVESPELLAKAVSWMKFPPVGIRGFGLSAAHVDYKGGTIPQMIAHFNEHTLGVLQIETQLAVDRIDELLSTPGIDVVMVGPVDLSISLGVPGDFLNPKMVSTVEKIRDACLAHNITPGIQVRNLALAQFWRERGMRFLGCASETAMLFERASEIVAQLK